MRDLNTPTRSVLKWLYTRRKVFSAHMFTCHSGDLLLIVFGLHNQGFLSQVGITFLAAQNERDLSVNFSDFLQNCLGFEISFSPDISADISLEIMPNGYGETLTMIKEKHFLLFQNMLAQSSRYVTHKTDKRENIICCC